MNKKNVIKYLQSRGYVDDIAVYDKTGPPVHGMVGWNLRRLREINAVFVTRAGLVVTDNGLVYYLDSNRYGNPDDDTHAWLNENGQEITKGQWRSQKLRRARR